MVTFVSSHLLAPPLTSSHLFSPPLPPFRPLCPPLTAVSPPRYVEKCDHLHEIIDAMKQHVFIVFYKLGCNNAPMAREITTVGVTDSNIMQYLGMIEQRISAVVHMYNIALGLPVGGPAGDKGNMSSSRDSGGSGALDGSRVGSLKPKPPSIGDPGMEDPDDGGEDRTQSRPVNVAEMRSHAVRQMEYSQVMRHGGGHDRHGGGGGGHGSDRTQSGKNNKTIADSTDTVGGKVRVHVEREGGVGYRDASGEIMAPWILDDQG